MRVIDYFQLDYVNLLNSVEGHNKCSSAYCLKNDQNGNEHCRFFYLFDTNEKSYIKYTTTSSNPGVNSNKK